MSRKPGTPNKPKMNVTSGELIIPVEKVEKEEPDYYIVCQGRNIETLSIDVEVAREDGYECQGGVSVTNYRANDGSIVMVYCQALVRK